jgi:polygalacturonase
MVIAHNHIYWGHGISIGSETNAGVTNMEVYDNSFMHSEEGLRIKSDYARGGEVSNINYKNICIRDADNALLFTTYYSTRPLPATGPRVRISMISVWKTFASSAIPQSSCKAFRRTPVA